jgi:SAM-dependent methyltransferase
MLPDKVTFDYALPVTSLQGPVAGASEVACVCGDRKGHSAYQVEDTPWSIMNCSTCGMGRLTPPPAADELASFYRDSYYGREGSKFRFGVELAVRYVARRRTRFLARSFRRGGRILDIGCGRGVLLNHLSDLGFETWGTEISREACQGASSKIRMRIADSLPKAAFEDSMFDGIVIWHVLEHLPNPQQTIKEAFRILKPGGRIIVAVPNYGSLQAKWAGAGWFHLDPPRHLFHFTVDALDSLLQRNGFGVLSRHHFSLRQNPFGWVQSALNRTGWFPRNELYSMLQAEPSGRLSSSPFKRLVQRLLWATGMPMGLALSVMTALLQSGATFHMVAEKPVQSTRQISRLPR